MALLFFPSRFFFAHFLVAFGHGGLARELDSAFFIDAKALDPNLVAQLHDVFGLLDSEIGQFTDVAKTVFARQELHEGAKLLDRDDFAAINLADLGFSGHSLDGLAGDLHAFFGHGVNINCAVVLNINLAPGLLDDALDVLAAGPNHRANLLRVNLQGDDARGIFAQ